MSIGRPVRLVPLVLSCCSSRLATWSASVGCSLVTTRTGDAERGRLHPPYPSGALQERYARKGGGTRWWVRGRTTTSGLHACTHAPGSAPHCCGSRCTAVGSVAATYGTDSSLLNTAVFCSTAVFRTFTHTSRPGNLQYSKYDIVRTVWNTSSHVILTADYINTAVFCTYAAVRTVTYGNLACAAQLGLS